MCVVNGKACNTTPSQAFIYHPYGMLDRDQRTTKTINCNLNHDVQSLDASKCGYCLCEKNSCNLNVEKNFKRQKDTTRPQTQRQRQISVLSSCRCSKKILQNSSNGNKISQSNKTPYTNFRRTKFNSLLICICIWLLLLQKTRALPFRMAEENNPTCKEIRDAIEPILKLAEVSYAVNYNEVENFTQAAFNDSHHNRHSLFRTTHYSWLYPNGKKLMDDYENAIPKNVTAHIDSLTGPPNREMLTSELTNLYQRFKILARAFEVIKDHEDETIAKYLKQQNEYVLKVLEETTRGMRKLRIQRPTMDIQIPQYNGVRELRDWIVTREHLKLLWYVYTSYELLLQQCA